MRMQQIFSFTHRGPGKPSTVNAGPGKKTGGCNSVVRDLRSVDNITLSPQIRPVFPFCVQVLSEEDGPVALLMIRALTLLLQGDGPDGEPNPQASADMLAAGALSAVTDVIPFIDARRVVPACELLTLILRGKDNIAAGSRPRVPEAVSPPSVGTAEGVATPSPGTPEGAPPPSVAPPEVAAAQSPGTLEAAAILSPGTPEAGAISRRTPEAATTGSTRTEEAGATASPGTPEAGATPNFGTEEAGATATLRTPEAGATPMPGRPEARAPTSSGTPEDASADAKGCQEPPQSGPGMPGVDAGQPSLHARVRRPSRRVCSLCGARSEQKLQVCTRCRRAAYCGRDCQAAHWPVHKSECHS
jgi:hypothetical protein